MSKCDKFVSKCKRGKLNYVRNNCTKVEYRTLLKGLEYACLNGKDKIVTLITDTNNINGEHTNICLKFALTQTNLKCANILMNRYNLKSDNFGLLLFLMQNKLEKSFKWYYTNLMTHSSSCIYVVRKCIKYGLESLAKWVYSFDDNIYPLDDIASESILMASNYNMIKWILERVSDKKYVLAYSLCILAKYQHIDIRFLRTIINLGASPFSFGMMGMSAVIAENNLNMLTAIDYFYTNIDYDSDSNRFFKEACLHNSVSVAKFIAAKQRKHVFEIFEIDKLFKTVCERNLTPSAKLLCSLNNEFKLKVTNDGRIYNYSINDHWSRIINCRNINKLRKLCNKIEKVDEDIECKICYEHKDKNIVKLCNNDDHTYCLECLAKGRIKKCLFCFKLSDITIINHNAMFIPDEYAEPANTELKEINKKEKLFLEYPKPKVVYVEPIKN